MSLQNTEASPSSATLEKKCSAEFQVTGCAYLQNLSLIILKWVSVKTKAVQMLFLESDNYQKE